MLEAAVDDAGRRDESGHGEAAATDKAWLRALPRRGARIAAIWGFGEAGPGGIGAIQWLAVWSFSFSRWAGLVMALGWVEVFAESAYGVRMLGYAHCVFDDAICKVRFNSFF